MTSSGQLRRLSARRLPGFLAIRHSPEPKPPEGPRIASRCAERRLKHGASPGSMQTVHSHVPSACTFCVPSEDRTLVTVFHYVAHTITSSNPAHIPEVTNVAALNKGPFCVVVVSCVNILRLNKRLCKQDAAERMVRRCADRAVCNASGVDSFGTYASSNIRW